jgi:hypothetical protein
MSGAGGGAGYVCVRQEGSPEVGVPTIGFLVEEVTSGSGGGLCWKADRPLQPAVVRKSRAINSSRGRR